MRHRSKHSHHSIVQFDAYMNNASLSRDEHVISEDLLSRTHVDSRVLKSQFSTTVGFVWVIQKNVLQPVDLVLAKVGKLGQMTLTT